MRQHTLIVIMLLAAVMLVACGSADDAPAQETAAEATQEVVLEADILPAPSNTAPATEPTEAPAQPTEVAAVQEPEVVEPAAPEEQPTPEPQPAATDAPQFNGEYEQTFYRGLATAPITMIDYSDFL